MGVGCLGTFSIRAGYDQRRQGSMCRGVRQGQRRTANRGLNGEQRGHNKGVKEISGAAVTSVTTKFEVLVVILAVLLLLSYY